MQTLKLTSGTIEHIGRLATLREKQVLSSDDAVELFDSIDSLIWDELNELYAIVNVGVYSDASFFDQYIVEAKSKGQRIVNELFEMDLLGSSLQKGVSLCLEKKLLT